MSVRVRLGVPQKLVFVWFYTRILQKKRPVLFFMTYQVHIYFKSFDNFYIDTSINKISAIGNYLKTFPAEKLGESPLHLLSKSSFAPKIFVKTGLLSQGTSKVISLPKRKKRFTVLRSPHIDKKSREQFEWTRYKKSIFFDFQKYSVFSLFLFLLKNSSFPGVEIEINLKHSTFLYTF